MTPSHAVIDHLPDEARMMEWVEAVCAFGMRRPGSDNGARVERWAAGEMSRIGLGSVTFDPIDTPTWEPGPARLVAWSVDDPEQAIELEGFPLPFTAAATVEADVVLLDRDESEVEGAIAVDTVALTRLPADWMPHIATPVHDPQIGDHEHVLPFGPRLGKEIDDAVAGGAVGYIGALTDMPWATRAYYVPYDAVHRDLPAAWIDRRDGLRLLELLAKGPVRGRIEVIAASRPGISHNITGVLPGATDEWVVIGSHHDAPWASAVEDATGIAMVLAQATAWAALPRERRPHNLLFLLNGGHMTGGAGIEAFRERQSDLLDRTVLAVHLEHAAAAIDVVDGRPVNRGEAEVVWWFTARDPRLERTVAEAITAHGVERAWVLPPEVFGAFPPTDGGPLHLSGVPVVDVLSAPVYLFDEADTVDLVHRPSLISFSRAAAQVIAATEGRTAAEARAGVVA